MKITGWIALGVLVSGIAHADIVCEGLTSIGPVKVEISKASVTITGAALARPQIYSSIDAQWDGHATELITAPGLAITYNDWYGCIHNAEITARLQDKEHDSEDFVTRITVDKCSGGSTPDEICHVNK